MNVHFRLNKKNIIDTSEKFYLTDYEYCTTLPTVANGSLRTSSSAHLSVLLLCLEHEIWRVSKKVYITTATEIRTIDNCICLKIKGN